MNRTPIEWVRNPDGTPGYTWNPITGCLNGCEYCYARKLANTRLRERYLANPNIVGNCGAVSAHSPEELMVRMHDPFYPRCWFHRREPALESKKPKGIFVCDMSDLFGVGIPEEWTQHVLTLIRLSPQHHFYLLTKQPQNLLKFSPFPDNAWVGVTATDDSMFRIACNNLMKIDASVRYISFEPLLSWEGMPALRTYNWLASSHINWVIIGQQTKPDFYPEWEWVREIIEACDKAGIPVFLKDNLGLPKLSADGGIPFYKRDPSGTMELRQELPHD